MSLHIITDPVLTPPHLHLQTPELSYHLGELTSKNEPETFATALGLLTQRYRELHSERLADDNPRRNSFALLAAFDAKEPDDVDSDGHNDDPLPLVVNTDGAVRFMGAEILTAVVEIVSPTHVLHISTEKDRDLPAVVMLRSQAQAQAQAQSNQHYHAQQSQQHSTINTPTTNNNNHNHNNNDNHNNITHQICRSCVVFTLEPGRLRPSKTLAADLRALRFVSYFLRNFHSTSSTQPENNSNHNTSEESRIVNHTSSNKSFSSNSKNSNSSSSSGSSSSGGSGRRDSSHSGSSHGGVDDADGCTDGCTDGPSYNGCYIRTGAIVDRQGYIAMLTLRTPPRAVHFKEGMIVHLLL